MEKPDALALFANDLKQRVIAAASAEEEGEMLAAAFTEMIIEDLKEAGEIDDGHECFHRANGIEVSGYGYGHDGETLDLFVTRYFGAPEPVLLARSQAEILISRLQAFLDRVLNGLHKKLEEASPVFDMALDIYQRWNSVTQVRFFLLTDGIVRGNVDLKKQSRTGRMMLNIRDLQHLYRFATSGQQQEPIHIDFLAAFGKAIPCLGAPVQNPDYDTYLALIPGNVLESIYGDFGGRLMELNVRSFLQARGKVNKAIRETIITQPTRFLAYNNGISATAEAVEVVDMEGGGKGIASIDNLQIVNGGQTTASIYQAARKDKADVSTIQVQAKITVPRSVPLEELVPLISRYANSQNKVDEADFSANDPYHLEIERWSRIVWAPPARGSQRQTRWFYERARGQYQVEISKQGTPAKKREWQVMHPPAQRFGKTDLAKFMNIWDQFPHLVSLGGQKNFREFTLRAQKENWGTLPGQAEFQLLIAKAILFKQAERIVGAERFGGYRANIVAYTLSYLARYAGAAADLDGIWARQGLDAQLEEAIRLVAREVQKIIVNPPNGGNVTEWCKKEACWKQVKTLRVTLPSGFIRGTVGGDGVNSGNGHDLSLSEIATIAEATDVPARTWYDVSIWASQNGQLTYVQRNIAMTLSTYPASGRKPSIKQAVQGLKLLNRARELGFEEEQVQATDR
jgi:hypothetical protein